MRRTCAATARTVPQLHGLESRTAAPLTLHVGVRGWAYDGVQRPDACSRQAGGRGAYALSPHRGPEGPAVFTCPAWARRFAARRGRRLPPAGVSKRRSDDDTTTRRRRRRHRRRCHTHAQPQLPPQIESFP
eukprot:COSAG01_NODE_6034_length_3888_cov_9.383215_6_plen_131_part_00